MFIFDVCMILKKDNSKSKDCFQERIKQKKTDIDHFKRLMLSNIFKNEYSQINNCVLFDNNDSVRLVDIIVNKPVLVLRCSVYNCPACVHHIVNKLKEHFSDYTKNPSIIVIYDSENMRYSKDICEKTAYVTNKRNILGLPMENRNMPFLFILDKDMKAKMFFIPDKGMPELTDEYLSILKKRMFSNI